jgi:hypothetical protein
MNYETKMTSQLAFTGAALALALATTPAMAGGDAKVTIVEPPANNGDFCNWLKNKPGTLYKNKSNPYIQEIGIFGRLHYQQSYIDGDSGGQDFSYDSEGEFRRLRLGAQIKFLNLFLLKANANFARDARPRGGDLDIDYVNIYEAQLTFNAQKAFGINNHSKFNLSYGKSEIKIAQESTTSSKKIKTIERSALANKVMPPNLTGAWLDAKRGKFGYYAGIFTSAFHTELAEWDAGQLYIARATYDFTDCTPFDQADALLAFSYADHDGKLDVLVGFDWAGSAAVNIKNGRANYMANLIFGENRDAVARNRGGNFWGVVLMPTYWIAQDRLEAVFRYQYAHASEAEGIRLNSRYARNAGHSRQENISDLYKGRGDEHHSAYLGLNYYFCGDNSKLMAGIEWDDINSENNDVYNGITYGLAYRMYF